MFNFNKLVDAKGTKINTSSPKAWVSNGVIEQVKKTGDLRQAQISIRGVEKGERTLKIGEHVLKCTVKSSGSVFPSHCESVEEFGKIFNELAEKAGTEVEVSL